MSVAFEVEGLPAPQGSKKLVRANGGRTVLIEDNAAAKATWRALVAAAGALAMRRKAPLDGELEVSVWFRFPMPKSRRAPVRSAGVAPHTVKPDIDKLCRAVLDGLTEGGVIADDARVASLHATKWEVTPGAGTPGVTVHVGPFAAGAVS